MSKIRQEYIKRINSVLDFVENNLEGDLSLEQLSQKAHYSPYHFHRIFSLIVGENLNEYINRKRIERIASILLVEYTIPIKTLAYTYGFNSESSFSRAFKKYYGVTPTKFKTEGKTILSKIGIEVFTTQKYICSIDNIKKWIEMNAQITLKELEGIKLAGIMHIGEFDKMNQMYQRLLEWGQKNEVLPVSNFKAITVYHDNPNVTQISKVRCSACITINRNIKDEGEIRSLTIQKGNYAVGNFVMNAEDFPKAWKSMSVWILENGYEFRDGDYFEVYLNDNKTHPEQKFIVDICIPIEKHQHNSNTSLNENLSTNKKQTKQVSVALEYHQLIGYMKKIRAFFAKEYDTEFKLGTIYQGNKDFSYFSLTTEELKKQKLKFVIILNHKKMCFSICLSGQNKSIRKKYWQLFKDSDWNTYHLAESINDSLSIIDAIIVAKPNFEGINALITEIELESFKFIKEIRAILE
ncbi:AraC family transcriptional regulator [Kordia sp.]|uniref:AraC family transcriptional regulator n=1 Tax=Kordia sp. TaxID=1965332 RepID=UPI003D6BCA32